MESEDQLFLDVGLILFEHGLFDCWGSTDDANPYTRRATGISGGIGYDENANNRRRRCPDGLPVRELGYTPWWGSSGLGEEVSTTFFDTTNTATQNENVTESCEVLSEKGVCVVRRRNIRRCIAGACCVRHVRFDPEFKHAFFRCRHRCVWDPSSPSFSWFHLCHTRVLKNRLLHFRPKRAAGCNEPNNTYVRFPEFTRKMHGIVCRRPGQGKSSDCESCNPFLKITKKTPSTLAHLSREDRIAKSWFAADRWKRRIKATQDIPFR